MSATQSEKIVLVPGSIDRTSVRRFVSEYTDQLEIASYGGENVHQLALDQQDKVDRMTDGWSEEDRLLFSKLYIEELNAHNNAQHDKANLLNAQAAQQSLQNAQNASNVAVWISIIVFFIIIILFVKIIK